MKKISILLLILLFSALGCKEGSKDIIVTYSVDGPVDIVASIGYTDEDGQMQYLSYVPVPWSKKLNPSDCAVYRLKAKGATKAGYFWQTMIVTDDYGLEVDNTDIHTGTSSVMYFNSP